MSIPDKCKVKSRGQDPVNSALERKMSNPFNSILPSAMFVYIEQVFVYIEQTRTDVFTFGKLVNFTKLVQLTP